jgi:hypothetical protein
LEAFLADQEAQKKAAEEEGKDPETTVTGKYSNELMRRTSWALPKFFGINFFMDKGGNYGSAHFCDNGCLFRINEI